MGIAAIVHIADRLLSGEFQRDPDPAGPAQDAAANSQDSLQSLNAALLSLGLDSAEIVAFDQFAKLLLQIHPNALRDLRNQLRELAAESTANNTTSIAPPKAGQTAPANQQRFQLTALSVSFQGINQALTQGGSTSRFSASQLPVQEVQVALRSPDGQTVRVQTPAPPAKPARTAAARVRARAATA